MHSRPSLAGSTPPVRGKHRDWLHKLGTLITVVVSVGMANFVSAQPSPHPLTLDAALTAAQSRSASLQAHDAATRAAREWLFLPVVCQILSCVCPWTISPLRGRCATKSQTTS